MTLKKPHDKLSKLSKYMAWGLMNPRQGECPLQGGQRSEGGLEYYWCCLEAERVWGRNQMERNSQEVTRWHVGGGGREWGEYKSEEVGYEDPLPGVLWFFATLPWMLHMWEMSLDQVTLKKGTEGLFQDCLGFLPSVNSYYDWNGMTVACAEADISP